MCPRSLLLFFQQRLSSFASKQGADKKMTAATSKYPFVLVPSAKIDAYLPNFLSRSSFLILIDPKGRCMA
jgi:hypothetical protein